MGVTYKLKQEVIDYLLELKRLDKNLSCRKVAELASAHFQKEISKSSVNAILKSSALSSPVGRRGKLGKAEKFKIPDHRKEQIFINVPLEVLGPKAPPPVKPSVVAVSAPVVTNMGVYLLKAVAQHLKRQGLLRFFFEKHGPIPCEEKILKLSETLLFMPFFGEAAVQNFPQVQAKDLWQMGGVDFEPTIHQKKECCDILAEFESKSQQLYFDYGQIFSEASFFQFTLEDETTFCIDSQMNTCWPENNVQYGFSDCLDKNFDFLSKCFTTNTNPIILREATLEENFSASFFQMLSALENLPGKRIKRIDMMTSQKENIVSFDRIISKKRFYIMGLFACRSLLSRPPVDKTQEPLRVDCACTGEVYFVTTATTAFRLPDGGQITTEIAFVSASKNTPPQFAVLTNIPTSVKPTEEVIEEFLSAWPGPVKNRERFQQRLLKAPAAGGDIAFFSDEELQNTGAGGPFQGTDFASRWLNALVLASHDHGRRHFFPPSAQNLDFVQARERFYGLPGQCRKENDCLRIRLVPGPAYPDRGELSFLAGRINESAVFTSKGHRLLIDV